MPTTELNKAVWDGRYDWGRGGEEWSDAWGGSSMQWRGTLLPRIRSFLPAQSALEIGPGFGRWTHFLKDECASLTLVDLSERCIEACRRRFADCANVRCFVNDGRSLAMVPDGSVDLVFSFDSLVHVDEDTMRAYVSQIARKLKPEGAAFIHHSNLGEHRAYVRVRSIAPLLVAALDKLGIIEDLRNQWRDPTMSAASMRALADASGLRCVSQELITWSTRRTLIDCISVLVRQGSTMDREQRTWRNPGFMDEAKCLSEVSRLYDMGAGPAGPATRS